MVNPSVGCHSWLRKMFKKWYDRNLVIIQEFFVILVILTIFITIEFFKDRLNSYRGYFLVRERVIKNVENIKIESKS